MKLRMILRTGFGLLLILVATLQWGCSGKDVPADIPAAQIEFEKARSDFWDKYFAAPNEIKASDVFNASREHTCSFEQKYGRYFRDWVGKVSSIRTDQGGDKVQKFEVTSEVNGVKVTYQQFDIERGTPLYQAISNLTMGSTIKFSFSFQPEPISSNVKECFDEASLTERGSLEEPEFRVVFQDLKVQ